MKATVLTIDGRSIEVECEKCDQDSMKIFFYDAAGQGVADFYVDKVIGVIKGAETQVGRVEDRPSRTNFEKYKDELLKGKDAISKKTGEPVSCATTHCDECELQDPKEDCNLMFIRWGFEEAKEKIKLTRRQRAFCEMVETGWLAADKNREECLFYYNEEPVRGSDYWIAKGLDSAEPIYIKELFPQFEFITWENSPFSIEELLTYEYE